MINITHAGEIWLCNRSDYEIINQANPFVNCTGYWRKWQKKVSNRFCNVKIIEINKDYRFKFIGLDIVIE